MTINYETGLKRGEQVEIHHPDLLPTIVTGTFIGMSSTSPMRMIELDGTGDVQFVPREWIKRPTRKETE